MNLQVSKSMGNAVVFGILALAIALLMSLFSRSPAMEPSESHPQPLEGPASLAPVQVSVADDWTDSFAWADASLRLETHDAIPVANGPRYAPREVVAPADPTNYGPRYRTDIHGTPVTNALLVVIHETVGTADSAIRLFQTRHERDADQVSYHSLIRRDGTIVHLVHPQMRAFGAGNSAFNSPNGLEAIQTNPNFPPSVNNFAYHTSLETPGDGRGNQRSHSGYTEAQYQSLAWLIARLPVVDERITTHVAVDRSGRRLDPRSFDSRRFFTLLRAYPRVRAEHEKEPLAETLS